MGGGERNVSTPERWTRDDVEVAHTPKAGWAWRCWLCDDNGFHFDTRDDARLAADAHTLSNTHRSIGARP